MRKVLTVFKIPYLAALPSALHMYTRYVTATQGSSGGRPRKAGPQGAAQQESGAGPERRRLPLVRNSYPGTHHSSTAVWRSRFTGSAHVHAWSSLSFYSCTKCNLTSWYTRLNAAFTYIAAWNTYRSIEVYTSISLELRGGLPETGSEKRGGGEPGVPCGTLSTCSSCLSHMWHREDTAVHSSSVNPLSALAGAFCNVKTKRCCRLTFALLGRGFVRSRERPTSRASRAWGPESRFRSPPTPLPRPAFPVGGIQSLSSARPLT